MGLKAEFLNNISNLLGKKDYDAYLSSLNELPKKSIRVNVQNMNLQTFENLANFSLQKNRVLNNAYYVDNEEKIGNSILHHAGCFYVQEPSACMPVFAVKDILKDKIVLDVCASPGGKTGQLAEFVGENGFVVSNEYEKSRINTLRSNVERMGYKNVAIVHNSAEELSNNLHGKIDIAVVDAPCGGEGMFRKNPATADEWSEEQVIENEKRQKEILFYASKTVKNGGFLVYSTCTFDIRENEEVVKWFLQSNEGYELVELAKEMQEVSNCGIAKTEEDKNLNLQYCRRFYPFRNFGEGQFVAVFKKLCEEDEIIVKKNNIEALTKNEEGYVKNFFAEIDFSSNLELCKVGGFIFAKPKRCVSLGRLDVVTFGVCVGNIEKNRFVPHHNFFKAFGREIKNKLNFKINDERINKFLFGEQICGDVKDGYVAILFEDVPLGFGKAKNLVINNHYPKGLRKVSRN